MLSFIIVVLTEEKPIVNLSCCDRLALQLLRIEEELGDKATYAGKDFRKPAWMAA